MRITKVEKEEENDDKMVDFVNDRYDDVDRM